MKQFLQTFIVKYGICPESVKSPVNIYEGERCILVYDKNHNCVGVVWKHFEKRYSPANGQAEIRFFDRNKDTYKTWHRMNVNNARLIYAELENNLQETDEYIYTCHINY